MQFEKREEILSVGSQAQLERLASELGIFDELPKNASRDSTEVFIRTYLLRQDKQKASSLKSNFATLDNVYFFDHDNVLNKITDALKNNRIVYLYGQAGVGKTLLANRYANEHILDFDGNIFWIDAANIDALQLNYVALDRGERSEDSLTNPIPISTRIAWVREKLNILSKVLLIFDNIDETDDNDSNFWEWFRECLLPAASQARILITGRPNRPFPFFRTIHVNEMEQDKATLFLLRHALQNPDMNSIAEAEEDDRKAARTLVERTEGLPLALEQIGAVLAEEQGELTLRDYLRRYDSPSERYILLQQGAGYIQHKPVYHTVKIAFQSLLNRYPEAAELLLRCAFFAPEPIPNDLLRLTENNENSAVDVAEARKIAVRYTLLRRDSKAQMVSLHRLVYDILPWLIPAERHKEYKQHALLSIRGVLDFEGTFDFLHFSRYLSHLEHMYLWIKEETMETEASIVILNELGCYYLSLYQLDRAETLLQQAWTIALNGVEQNSSVTAITMHNIAGLYKNQQKWAKAEKLYMDASMMLENIWGREHPSTATTLRNLARLYADQGKYAEAEPLYQESLAIKMKVVGREHPSTAATLHALARLYVRQSKYAEAEPLEAEALGILERMLPPEHPHIQIVREGLTMIQLLVRRR